MPLTYALVRPSVCLTTPLVRTIVGDTRTGPGIGRRAPSVRVLVSSTFRDMHDPIVVVYFD